MATFDIKTYLKEKRDIVDSYLKSYFSIPSEPSVLHEAMRYSLFAGGKRIRPILALASYEACGGDPEDIIPQAAALELIHTYSLIHDDLPAMDNDDLRRGKPTSHKVFGEAMAILTGDALLTEAFYMLSSIKVQSSKLKAQSLPPFNSPLSKGGHRGVTELRTLNSELILKVIREVAMAAGAHGMVGGQAQDILSENSEPDRDTLAFIHLHKTAALITASVRMGPILAESGEDILTALTKYGENIGLTFQIIDDILDIEGNTYELGKPAGSDERMKKMTYPALFGIEHSRQKAKELISKAIDALKIFSFEANPLRKIARYLLKRRV
ncbi:MAG: polyprenyl synthetase family protein [Nitrospirae bacterium]|nr:polyprenyl synthetase family protein [Nitrospirota bacterium]